MFLCTNDITKIIAPQDAKDRGNATKKIFYCLRQTAKGSNYVLTFC